MSRAAAGWGSTAVSAVEIVTGGTPVLPPRVAHPDTSGQALYHMVQGRSTLPHSSPALRGIRMTGPCDVGDRHL